MFTSEIGVDAIKLEASTIPVDQEIMEYEKITISANDSKTIALDVSNSTSQVLHYGAWYQMVSPDTINDNITIAKLIDSPDETSGTIDGNSNKIVYIYIGNNSSSEITLYVGIKYSETSSLGLPNNRTLITGTRDGKYVVGVTVTNGTVENGVTSTNLLKDGNFENTGLNSWDNCLYNPTYKKYGNYSCQLTASASVPEIVTTNHILIPLNSSHYYYARVEGYQTNTTENQWFEVFFPSFQEPLGSIPLQTINKWNIYSVINNRSNFSDGSYALRFDYENIYHDGTIYYDGGMLLDLTNSYGSSYPTKEILDRSIGYFDGTVSYNYQKLNKGNSTSFTIIPNNKYEINNISCTNSNATYNNNILTINNITGDVNCNVEFVLTPSAQTLEKLGLSSNGVKDKITSAAPTDEGIWETQDDYGTTYYFRGAVTNNYVKFAGFYWRIIRINGNGSIRLIYDGTEAHANGESSSDRLIGGSAYNSSYYDNAHLGYMYGQTGAGTYEATHANINNSTIKTVVDNWYKTNIVDKGYSDKVEEDAIYCNDRSLASGPGNSTNITGYIAPYRVLTNKQSTMKCPQLNQDGMSTNNASKGNKALTYPVALITMDEVAYGGGWDVANNSYYLYTGQNYWTMSPDLFNEGKAVGISVYYNGQINNYNYTYITNGVRPVLSLKASVELQGSGTISDPYVVQ